MYVRIILHLGETVTKELTGENRCWPCTIANAAIGLVVAWLPLAVALVKGERSIILLGVGWGIVLSVFTLYRLVDRGYLPLAEPVAKLTGFHERIGPGSKPDSESERNR